MDIERLIEDLFNATYREPDTPYEYTITCTKAQREALEKVIRTWAKSQHILGEVNELRIKLAELEAKLFAYEAIISKSNFKPMLPGQEWLESEVSDE